MPIDTSGRWWKGSVPEDIEEYLRAYVADGGITLDRTVICQSSCGSQEFELDADRNEGCARWTCTKCHETRFIGDSAEFWAGAKPKRLRCVSCKQTAHNLGVGFSLRSTGDVRWMTIGERCLRCGTLSSFVDWKVDGTPTHHLFEKV
jgi:hypothetical protein